MMPCNDAAPQLLKPFALDYPIPEDNEAIPNWGSFAG